MAEKQRFSLPGLPWWFGGCLALLLILVMTALPMFAMLHTAGTIHWPELLNNPYLQQLVRFSFWQASLSTLLSVGAAIPLALALSHLPQFPGRRMLVTLFGLSLVIPTIAAIYGIVAVYGRSGWLSSLLIYMDLPALDFYGIQGILIAHVFFNMPLAARLILLNLESIPHNQWQLAGQLGMQPVSLFRHIEWPVIRDQLPGISLLIFTLCFTSFAIVMTLGGGPHATTIEVAIYQALRFDFDLVSAVALAMIQLCTCLALFLLALLYPQDIALRFESGSKVHAANRHQATLAKRVSSNRHWVPSALWHSPALLTVQVIIVICTSAFVVLPLSALLISGINSSTVNTLLKPSTVSATVNTVLSALSAGVLSVTLATCLLLTSRHLRIRLGYERSGQLLHLSGNVILVLPPLVLGTGLFLLLRNVADVFSIALVLVVLINSLLALPFVLRTLETPLMRIARQSDQLAQSLGIQGISRWRLIDWPQLRQPIGFSLALATTLSAGDLGAIALFGSERVSTLPLLLYQRMGSHRLSEAGVTAAWLLLVCLILFLVITTLLRDRSYADSRQS